ncbi:DMT family transporter [Mycetocola tolaasinivorans]|nr:DMT family transporter [Mycetocola tolaasinivorans]
MVVGSAPLFGVLLALVSAAVLAVGNLWQSRGVNLVSAAAEASGENKTPFLALLRTPIWIAGSALFGVAILLQMGSLAFAPLILVQPIGVTALVFSAVLNARVRRKPLPRRVLLGIAISLIGVIAYVIIAALVSKQKPISDGQLSAILITLAAVLAIAAAIRFGTRGTAKAPIFYVVLGGIFSGFVATLGKTVILRVETMFAGHRMVFDSGSVLTLICVLGIGVASALSIYFVQYSHTCNPPDVVIAGLTVVDPAVAVVLGITILHEAAGAPVISFVGFILAGAAAFIGVVILARAENAEEDAQSTETIERGAQRSAESA